METPGYRILREVGRSSVGHVYLARAEAFGPLVVLKVVAPELAADPAFQRRLLEDCRAAGELAHPGIVRLREAGRKGDSLCLVSDYVRGGNLKDNVGAGLHLQNAVAIIRDAAAALGHAHERGVTHGDVREENILVDEQGRARLAGFGIAGAVAVAEAPRRPLPSVAADLHDLGAVLYATLTGATLPDGGDRVGDAPLPPSLSAFGPVLRRLLASAPGERFKDAGELVAALDELRASGALPNVALRSDEVDGAEIATVAAAQAPASGADDDSDSARGRLVAFVVLGSLLLGLAGAGWYVASQPGAVARLLASMGLAEHPDVAIAWQDAEALQRDPGQSLEAAVAAYRRVLALDPAHSEAATAIGAVALKWKRDFQDALGVGDAALAETKLAELAAVFPEDADLAALFEALADRRQGEKLLADTERLLDSAGLSHTPSVDAAIVTYKAVLRLIPGDPTAQAALNDIAEHYGELAEQFARAKDLPMAMANFDRATSARADFARVEAVRATISEAEALKAEVDAMLGQAAAFREAGALIGTGEDSAADIYRRVLATDPDNAIASQGLIEVSAQVLANFDALLAGGRLDEARALTAAAVATGIGEELTVEMNARYERELTRIDTVQSLIAEAEALFAEGYVTTGPERDRNAVARLREALLLDPDNADGIRGLSVAATRLATVAAEAYDAGMAEQALDYLDLALAVTPGIRRWRQQRDRWQAELERRPRVEEQATEITAQ